MFNKQRAAMLIFKRNIDLASIFSHDYTDRTMNYALKDSWNVIEEKF